jgi:Ca2+-binding RTX toxin-like protein
LTKSFKDWLASSGPDTMKTPTLSREERLTKFMPPAVIEMLEKRRLMALTVSFDAGTLEIDGTTLGDNISVSINAGDTLIHIADGNGTPYNAYDPTNVSLIKILAGGGTDNVFINRSGANAVSEVCLIYGEAGNDTIQAGSLGDTVYGGDGNDNIQCFEGVDSVLGGNDSDTIDGGIGNDILNGEAGPDSVLGDAGNDWLYGGAGNDTLNGGSENDEVYGEADNDSILDPGGSDHLLGGDGDDSIDSNDSQPDTIDGGLGNDIASVSAADVVSNVETVVL